jgi:preprotein translocase subunit SecB
MSDQPDQPAATPNAGAGQLPITVKTQYVKDLSFENPKAPQSLQAMQATPSIQISVNVGAQHLAEQDYEVTIVINAEAKTGEETLFVVELTYAGVFGLGQVAPEHVRPLLLIEGPRLLFPFARNVVAHATREGGFPPLLIQPVDFVELYRREITQQGQGRPA